MKQGIIPKLFDIIFYRKGTLDIVARKRERKERKGGREGYGGRDREGEREKVKGSVLNCVSIPLRTIIILTCLA